MDKNNRHTYANNQPHTHKNISQAPTLMPNQNQTINPHHLSTQMRSLKLNKSDNRGQSDKEVNNSNIERYEANDEAFIEFSTLGEPNTFDKSYSNMNILGDLDEGYSNRDDDRYGKRSKNETETDILGQLDFLLESSMPSQNDIDVRGMCNSYGDRNNDMDKFTEELMMDSIDKQIMYEPMVDVKKMTQNYMKKSKDQMSSANMRVLTVIENIIDLLHRNECKTVGERKKILALFDELQTVGGLPKAVEKEAAQKYPDMVTFIAPKSEKDYVIF